jgi:hypothetical protein
MHKLDIDARSRNNCYSVKAITIALFWVCVYVAFFIQHARRMRHIIPSRVAGLADMQSSCFVLYYNLWRAWTCDATLYYNLWHAWTCDATLNKIWEKTIIYGGSYAQRVYHNESDFHAVVTCVCAPVGKTTVLNVTLRMLTLGNSTQRALGVSW